MAIADTSTGEAIEAISLNVSVDTLIECTDAGSAHAADLMEAAASIGLNPYQARVTWWKIRHLVPQAVRVAIEADEEF
tara:strand:+ start:8009 stop:8242 length:234 start_codon:yes stop_codon:yes gene_type:complete